MLVRLGMSPVMASYEGVEEMRQEIWSNLPMDLMLRAVSFLPFESLIRFSVLSKYWHQVVPTIKLRDNIGFVTVDLVSVDPEMTILSIYSTLKGQWVPIATLAFQAKHVASSRGILCLLKDRGLIVCNPISTCRTLNARRELEIPAEASFRWCLCIGMDSGEDCYKIVYIDDRDLYVYDSTQDSWDTHEDFYMVIENDRFCYYGFNMANLVATFSGSILYFVTTGADMCTLRSYNTFNKTTCTMATWRHRLLRGERHTGHTDFQLVSCMDQLMMVNYHNCPTTSEFTIGVHHFNESMKRWEQMSRAPAALVQDMNDKLFKASACENLIVVYSELEGKGAAFDVANGKWSRTPSVPSKAVFIRPIATSCGQNVMD